jgi:hypothetical protein
VPAAGAAVAQRGGAPSVIVDGTVLESIPRTRPTRPAAPAAPVAAPQPSQATAQPAEPAERRWALTGFAGVSIDEVPFSRTVLQPWSGERGKDTILGVAGSYRVARFWRWFTIDAELGAGGRVGQTNAGEAWGALYLRFDGFPWNHLLYTSVAGSTGLHWVSRLPERERGPPERREPNTSNVLHYFAPEITVALPHRRQHELVLRYHHRSGIFGAMNGVDDGANAIAIGYRYRLPFH